ncbi:hypothetical protein L1987_54475 [Smallanthus sonchifolius]|uniref:Uncharacterized protein n=1 Tax=Smallanthus sonchifolius TaxID=185202 RepID=A0ACB9E7A9_9ASTR|nr:hypothetical protein L1987_54475 [Smallanthus sonchifolius]
MELYLEGGKGLRATGQVVEGNLYQPAIEFLPMIKEGFVSFFLLESLGLSDCDDVLPLYVGDDKTDDDAFNVNFLREGNRGYGILVTPSPKESGAYYILSGIHQR